MNWKKHIFQCEKFLENFELTGNFVHFTKFFDLTKSPGNTLTSLSLNVKNANIN